MILMTKFTVDQAGSGRAAGLAPSLRQRCILATLIGVVNRVKEGESRNGSPPLSFVSIEGFSLLCSGEVVPPPSQALVKARVRLFWPKDGKPQHWLDSWVELAV